MQLEVRKTGRLEPLFIDIHGEAEGTKLRLEVILAIEASVERLAGTFYMDGSDSMRQSGNYGRRGGLLTIGKQKNLVEEAMRVAIPYIAAKDASKECRVAYWATGADGKRIEPLGEFTSGKAAIASFPGPSAFGNGTYLLPAIQDFVSYIHVLHHKGEAIDAALAVVVTDGQFHDMAQVSTYIRQQLAPSIIQGTFPRTVFTLVGIGSSIDEEQMEELAHKVTPREYPFRPIFCYALADTLDQLPTLVSHLLDANTPAFYGGATLSAAGHIVSTYEDMVPAVLTFSVPLHCRSFSLHVDGNVYTQGFDVVAADH